MAAGDRNRGSILLARTGLSQEVIAQQVGAKLGRSLSRVSVAHWMAGTTKPNDSSREALQALYSIPKTAWDEPPELGKTLPVAAPQAPVGRLHVPDSVLGKASVLEQMAHDLLVGLQTDAESTPLEKARVMASVASTLHLLAKLTGQLELGEKLLQLPQWKAVAKVIEEVLRRHPGALEDFEAAMRGLDDQVRGAA